MEEGEARLQPRGEDSRRRRQWGRGQADAVEESMAVGRGEVRLALLAEMRLEGVDVVVGELESAHRRKRRQWSSRKAAADAMGDGP